MNAAENILRQFAEQQADDRAHRLATIAAEEFIRCNGLSTDTPDLFVFHRADLADEHFQECVAHLKWHGECVTFENGEEIAVLLGDYTSSAADSYGLSRLSAGLAGFEYKRRKK